MALTIAPALSPAFLKSVLIPTPIVKKPTPVTLKNAHGSAMVCSQTDTSKGKAVIILKKIFSVLVIVGMLAGFGVNSNARSDDRSCQTILTEYGFLHQAQFECGGEDSQYFLPDFIIAVNSCMEKFGNLQSRGLAHYIKDGEMAFYSFKSERCGYDKYIINKALGKECHEKMCHDAPHQHFQ